MSIAATVAKMCMPFDLPMELELLELLGGHAPERRKCPLCSGSGGDAHDTGAVRQRQKGTDHVWLFEGAQRGRWECYDESMTSLLEDARSDGAGAIVHLSASDDSGPQFEFVQSA